MSFYDVVRHSIKLLKGDRKVCDYLYCDGNMTLKTERAGMRGGRFQGKFHVSMITHGLFGPQIASWTEVFQPVSELGGE